MAHPQSTTAPTTSTFEVQLAVYDLARGMARTFLGAQGGGIDVVPHTGLVVYGREWFFGDGIQSEDPEQFRRSTGMVPYQLLSLGRTTVPLWQFEQWCARMVRNGTYSPTAYDLLNRNCNNFSRDAATQGLGMPAERFPAWILDVPRRFLSSPVGQMVRPLLENMRITHPAGAQSVLTSSVSSPAAVPATASASVASDDHNPWANIPAKTSEDVATENGTSPNAPSGNGITAPQTPLLDSFTKPLLSSDTKTVTLCIQKLIAHDEKSRKTLEDAAPILQSPSAGKQLLSLEQTQAVSSILLGVLQSDTGATTTTRMYALMLLRIVLLRCTDNDTATTDSLLSPCIDWLSTELANNSDNGTSSKLGDSVAARSMAWLAASNAVAVLPDAVSSSSSRIIDAAIRDASHERPEVRQAASAFLYNAVLRMPLDDNNDVSDTVVSILCALLETVADETDATTRLRKLLILGRIFQPRGSGAQPHNEAAKQLAVDLGLLDVLEPLVAATAQDDDCKTLASELVLILQS